MAEFSINLTDIDRQLCVVPKVNIFKNPQLTAMDGYRCTGWEGNQIWSGRLRVMSQGKNARVILDDPSNGNVFAVVPLDHPNAVEKCIDSSRYFVVRVVAEQNGQTKQAFVGIGMDDRNHAFDFNVACDEARKFAKEAEERERNPQMFNEAPPIQDSGKSYGLADGEKIKLALPSGAGRKKREVPPGGLRL